MSQASVSVADEPRADGDWTELAAIGSGLLVLACAMAGDEPGDIEYIANKVAALRIFPDDAGRMNRSVLDASGEILLVSQFTLAADTRKGRRPAFVAAAAPDVAERAIDSLASGLRAQGATVKAGRFAAHMHVALVNDGPVTIWLDSRDR